MLRISDITTCKPKVLISKVCIQYIKTFFYIGTDIDIAEHARYLIIKRNDIGMIRDVLDLLNQLFNLLGNNRVKTKPPTVAPTASAIYKMVMTTLWLIRKNGSTRAG